MPIIQKRVRKARSHINNAAEFAHCTPTEAAALSKNGQAIGFDLLRWGEEWHKSGDDEGFTAATATAAGVRCCFRATLEKDYVWEIGIDHFQRRARKAYVHGKNFFPWGTLSRINEDFIFSLHWVPEIPMSPLEALAEAGK